MSSPFSTEYLEEEIAPERTTICAKCGIEVVIDPGGIETVVLTPGQREALEEMVSSRGEPILCPYCEVKQAMAESSPVARMLTSVLGLWGKVGD